MIVNLKYIKVNNWFLMVINYHSASVEDFSRLTACSIVREYYIMRWLGVTNYNYILRRSV